MFNIPLEEFGYLISRSLTVLQCGYQKSSLYSTLYATQIIAVPLSLNYPNHALTGNNLAGLSLPWLKTIHPLVIAWREGGKGVVRLVDNR